LLYATKIGDGKKTRSYWPKKCARTAAKKENFADLGEKPIDKGERKEKTIKECTTLQGFKKTLAGYVQKKQQPTP